MPRNVSPAVRALLDSHVAETYDTLDLILPLRPGETESSRIIYYFSRTSGIEYGGHLYLPLLRQISAIKFSLGKASDNAEVSIENVSRTFGVTLSDTSRRLDGAKAIIRKVFVTTAGYEPYDIFHGYVRDTKINQDNVTLNLISDMSRRSAQVASRAVTQRCIWTFRGAECGWTPDQPGDPTMCNKVFEDDAGCKGHGNQPRFGGVPTLTPKVQEIIGRLGDGWDFPNDEWRNRGWRFDQDYPFAGRYQPVMGNMVN